MKKGSTMMLGIAIVGLMLISPALAADEAMKPVILKMTAYTPPPETSLTSSQTVMWQEMVTAKTKGMLTFKNYWAGALAKPAEHITMVQTGAADLAQTYGWYTPTKLPLENFDYTFPFGPTDPYIVTQAMRQIYEEFPQFKKDLEKHNCTRVFQMSGLNFVFLGRKQVTKLDDFKGLKCAMIGRYFGKWIGATGAVPVAAPAQERYTMLQTGVVDVSFNPMEHAYAFKDVEQGPYCLDPKIVVTNYNSLWINLDTLKKLPPGVQAILLESGKEVETRATKELNGKWAEKIMNDWRKVKGFTYTQLSDVDRQKWADSCEDVPGQWAAEVSALGYPGWEIVNRFQEITAQLGHKWNRKWGVKK
jgi:TRAP-type C4-dicarboxylate transport system substrate-binding protein